MKLSIYLRAAAAGDCCQHMLLAGESPSFASEVLIIALFESIGNSAASKIVRRQLDGNPVTGKDSDVMHPHLARNMRQDHMLVLQLHTKHRIGKGLQDRSLKLDDISLAQSTSLAIKTNNDGRL